MSIEGDKNCVYFRRIFPLGATTARRVLREGLPLREQVDIKKIQ